MNTVEVNDEKIHAELDAAGAGRPIEGEHIPAGGGAPGANGQAQPGPDQLPVDWTEAALAAVFVIDKVVVPNWNLEADEKDALALGAGRFLNACFPNVRTDARVTALFALLTTVAVVASRRRNNETGEFIPMRAPKPETDPAADPDANRAAA